jgi:hypothetical protein
MAKQSDDYFASIELVGHAIGLLIGDRDEEFDLERALRLFQLKCWLINRFETTVSFNWSKKIFTSMSIGVVERRNRLSHLIPAERFTLIFSTILAFDSHYVVTTTLNLVGTMPKYYLVMELLSRVALEVKLIL